MHVESDGPIELATPQERRSWSEKLGVTEEELQTIVDQIGPDLETVQTYLRNASPVH